MNCHFVSEMCLSPSAKSRHPVQALQRRKSFYLYTVDDTGMKSANLG